ncbi:MAG TPA: FG-GAP-like repeat-containing protein [Pyrinomonadaceae bacterium]|nr:FG-GAP-like repeat-containing protein [Pyrinomonadaceae bacterium]
MSRSRIFNGYGLITLFVLVLSIFCGGARATGELDTFFKGGVGELSGDVRAAVIQPDGKVIIAGKWTALDDKPSQIIARFNTDGSRDLSFNPAVFSACCLSELAINDMILQPDGKILVAGGFLAVAGEAHQMMARLNSDGSVDNAFNYGGVVGSATNGTIADIELLPDGKVMAAGFMGYGGSVNRNSLVRFNSNGTLDLSFDPGSMNGCFAAKATPDGKVLASCKLNTSAFIKKFNTDGTADPSFLVSTGTGTSGFVRGIAELSDGKYFAYGDFTTINNNTDRKFGTKINTDGSLDMSFNAKGSGFGGEVKNVIVEPDGQLVAVGRFSTYNGTASDKAARINADGSLDASFSYDTVYFFQVPARVLLQGDGKYFIGGLLNRNVQSDSNAKSGGYFRRLNTDGSSDNTFASVYAQEVAETVRLAQQSDGKILVGGTISVNGRRFVNNLIRLNFDGSPDPTFTAAVNVNNIPCCLQVLPDDKILVGSTSASGSSLIRLNSNGSLDDTFSAPVVGGGTALTNIAVLPDGKILVSGFINSRVIVRLNSNGSLDNTFDSGGPVTSTPVLKIVPLADGKIIITGGFTAIAGIPRGRIARLNANGSLDNTFNPPVGADNSIGNAVILPDGKILIAGSFTAYNTTPRKYLARLTSDGALDPTFADPGITGISGGVGQVKILPNGKILIAGSFNTVGGNSSPNIARLNADGTWDPTFNVGTGTNAGVGSMILQPNGRIVIAGSFTLYNGQPVLGIARLINSNAAWDFDGDGRSDISIFRPSDGNWYLMGSQIGFNVNNFGQAGDRLASADYDGDGRSDLGIYRDGAWWYLNSSTGTVGLKFWGGAGDVPLPADFDGDGRADFIYYHPATNEWFRSGSTGVSSTIQWGIPGDIPVSGDFDGDGKASPIAFRPSTGLWGMRDEAGGWTSMQWGQSGDIPVAADYDADGKTDVAVWRPSNSAWYIYNSGSGTVTIMGWGLAGDRPVPGDFDGDGKADVAVWRPSNGVWYIMQSTSGFTGMQFGISSDQAVPSEMIQ